MHAYALIQYQPSAFNAYSPYQLNNCIQPDLSHLRSFGCQVMVPITPPKLTKMGPQQQPGIYVRFDSPSVIRYLELTIGDIFKARFLDYHFDKNIFPTLSKPDTHHLLPLEWERTSPFWEDIKINQGEKEVQRILQLHKIVEELPDSFVDATMVSRSHIPIANVPARIDLPDNPTIVHQP